MNPRPQNDQDSKRSVISFPISHLAMSSHGEKATPGCQTGGINCARKIPEINWNLFYWPIDVCQNDSVRPMNQAGRNLHRTTPRRKSRPARSPPHLVNIPSKSFCNLAQKLAKPGCLLTKIITRMQCDTLPTWHPSCPRSTWSHTVRMLLEMYQQLS